MTPGPIVPAREQLGYLLLEQNQPGLALKEFETALANAPGGTAPSGRCACCRTLRPEVDSIVVMQATISNDRLISIFVQDSLLMDSCIDRKSDKWFSAVNWCQQGQFTH